jgi:hypothetical protein
MSSVQILAAEEERPTGAGGRDDEVWGDLELPGWDEFTGARDRFFANLRRTHREHGLPSNEVEGPEKSDPGTDSPR